MARPSVGRPPPAAGRKRSADYACRRSARCVRGRGFDSRRLHFSPLSALFRSERTAQRACASSSRWWYRCLARAGVVDEGTTHGKKMHGARYTSGTEFYLATGDIYATQQLLGHADVSTTANIYVQGSPADLEAKLHKVWGE